MIRSLDTVVIGAGISGLAYAHARGPDVEVIVVEASSEAGGWVHTERGGKDGEVRFERGPEALQSGSQELSALCSELSLELVPAPHAARKRYLVHRGRLEALPHSLPAFVASPLLSWRGKLRLLTEPLRNSRTALEGSLADFVRHRFGQEVVDALLDPFVSGVHAGDPEQLSLRATFPALAKSVEQHGSLARSLFRGRRGAPRVLCKPRGGMGALADALVEQLGSRVRKSTPARSIASHDARFRVTTDDEIFDCARVIVATPAQAAVELLRDISAEAARAIATLTCESLAVVIHTWPREKVEHPLDGFGYLVPSRARQLQLGTLFSSSIDPDCAPEGTVVLRTLLGGARRPEVVEQSDGELLAAVQLEVAPLLGLHGEPSWSRILRYRSVLPRYDLAHPARLQAIEAGLARTPGLHVLGNHLTGIGVPTLIEAARALAREHERSS